MADRIHALAQSKLRSELDARFADVDLAEAKLLLLDADNSRQAALAALAAVLGEDEGPPIEVVEETAPLEKPAPDVGVLLAAAVSRRPDLAALEFDARAAERLQLAERDLSLPSIRALGAAGGAPWRNEAISPWYGAIGVNVEIPVFNGFLFGARAKEAEYRAQATRQRLLEQKNEVVRDVRTAWLDANAAYARLDVARQLLEQANAALDLARSRYDLGISLDRGAIPGAAAADPRGDRQRGGAVPLPRRAGAAAVSGGRKVAPHRRAPRPVRNRENSRESAVKRRSLSRRSGRGAARSESEPARTGGAPSRARRCRRCGTR